MEQTIDLAAGLEWGLVQKEGWTEIQTCEADVDATWSLIWDALHLARSKNPVNWAKAAKEFKQALTSIPGDVSACVHTYDDWQSIVAWASLFKDPANAKATMQHNAKRHLPALTNDLRKLRADLKADEYFQAGVEAGTMLAIVTVPVSAEEFAQEMNLLDAWL